MIEVFLEYRGRAVSRSSGYFGRTPDRDRLRFRPCRPRGTTWWEANQRGRQAGSVTRSSYSDSRPRSGAVSAVVRGRTARRATAAATGLVLRGRERRGVIAAMTASRAVWDGVAPLPWHGDQGERRAATGRVDEVGGVVLVDPEPAWLRDAVDVEGEDVGRGAGGRRGCTGAGLAVHERVTGPGWPGRSRRAVPAGAQVGDGVGARSPGGPAGQTS